MSELYPYCSKCDNELSEEEKNKNEESENLFYPICDSCLDKHVKGILGIAEAIE